MQDVSAAACETVSRERPSPGAGVDLRLWQANERTLLAWIRTSVALMGFGFVIARLAVWRPVPEGVPWTARLPALVGAGFVILGALCSAISARRYRRIRTVLLSGKQPAFSNHRLELILAAALTVMGVLLAVYVLFT